jgi:hypothetical protein
VQVLSDRFSHTSFGTTAGKVVQGKNHLERYLAPCAALPEISHMSEFKGDGDENF